MAKRGAKGIPDRDDQGDHERLELGDLADLFVQRHDAERAGRHLDYRIGTPETGLLSWATKKEIPKPGERGIGMHRQPLHDHEYGDFEGRIESGYGKGDVTLRSKNRALVTKVTPDALYYTIADQRAPQRFLMLRTAPERPWLLLNVTKREPLPFGKEHFKSVPPDEVRAQIDAMPVGSSVQAKVDGAAVLTELSKDKAEVYSHRLHKGSGRPIVHTERFFGGVPRLDIPKHLRGTVLRGELYGERDGKAIHPQELGGLLNSNVEKSIRDQRDRSVELRQLVFDVKRLGKKVIDSSTPYDERKRMIAEALAHLPKDKFHLPKDATTPEDARRLLSEVETGKNPLSREGVVIHPPTGTPTKSKLHEERDVYITGVFPGGGKYEGSGAGGFTYSHEPGGKTVGRVGTGISDELRRDLLANADLYVGRAARVRAQEQHASGALRAPRLIALHEEKTAGWATQYAHHAALNAGQAARDARYLLDHPDAKSRLDALKLRVPSLANNLLFTVLPPRLHHTVAEMATMEPGALRDWFLHGFDPWDHTAPKLSGWAQDVTENSHAMDLEPGVFTKKDPKQIARSVYESARASGNLKSTPYRSAMSMLTFYVNRAGKSLPPERRAALQAAKAELRELHKTAYLIGENEPHQQRVIDRMKRPDQRGLVVLHGLGSGKTRTSIGVADALGAPADVVLPAALRGNYEKEVKKHVEGTRPDLRIQSLENVARHGGRDLTRPLLIVDEAHRARNPTKTQQALRRSTAQKRLLLTGSLFYNRPADMAGPINLVAGEGTLPQNPAEFDRYFVQRYHESPGLVGRLLGREGPERERLNPAGKRYLRAVLDKFVDYYPGSKEHFPEVSDRTIKVPMAVPQADIYDTLMNRAPAWVREKVVSGMPPTKSEMAQLNAFLAGSRQVSNTTAPFRTKEPQYQPKIEAAAHELQKLLETNPRAKAVVYSNYLTAGLEPYKHILDDLKIPYGEFTGEMPKARRDQLVRDYNDDKLHALLLSSAGGEGLDLKGTRLVQLLEPHWNEEKLRQVRGRGVRYMSHDHLPESERNVEVQRYLSTLPRRSLLEKLKLKSPPRSADEYLHEIATDKERLNDEFRALLKI